MPMLATAADTVAPGPAFCWEPKWDGFRAIVSVDENLKVRIVSRRGRRWQDAFPELAEIGRAIGGPVVLDGEIVVTGPDGRPNFSLLSRRLHSSRRVIGRASHAATFVAFDVLSTAGALVIDRTWQERRQVLVDLDLDGTAGAVTTSTSDDGDALLTATKQLGVEGIVGKRRTSRYLCGRRSRSWVKIKHRGSGYFDVIGWRPPGRNWPAGGVVLSDNGEAAGTAIPAFDAIHRAALRRLVDRYGTPSGRGPMLWLPPGVQARVEYLERSPRGLLREAVARELRPALPA